MSAMTANFTYNMKTKINNLPVPLSPEDREAILNAWDKVVAARSASYGYFRELREACEVRHIHEDCNVALRAWSAEVAALGKGSDKKYTKLSKISSAEWDRGDALISGFAGKYPWLKDFRHTISDSTPRGEVLAQLQRAYAEAVLDVLRQHFKSRFDPLRKIIEAGQFSTTPEIFEVGAYVCLDNLKPVRISRKTHGGARIFATDRDGKEIRLHKFNTVSGPLARTQGYRSIAEQVAKRFWRLEKKWEQAIVDAGIERPTP